MKFFHRLSQWRAVTCYNSIGLILLVTCSVNAQGTFPGTIKGKILADEDLQPIEYATIFIFEGTDTVATTGALSTQNGSFEVSGLREGKYILLVKHIGFTSHRSDTITLTTEKPVLDLGKIVMATGASGIDTVKISSEQAMVEYQMDKTIYRIDKAMSNSGENAFTVLEIIPGIELDPIAGSIALRDGGVEIFINGKPTGLPGSLLKAVLDQIPANQIKHLEVMTNPSARYEREGTGGIINIVLKRERDPGINWLIDGNAGIWGSGGANTALNIRKKKFSVSIATGFKRNVWFLDRETNARFSAGDSLYFQDQLMQTVSHQNYPYIRIGTDVKLDTTNSLKFNFMYYGMNTSSQDDLTFDFRDSEMITSSSITNDRERTGNKFFVRTSAEYEHSFKQEDRKITFRTLFNYHQGPEAFQNTTRSVLSDYIPDTSTSYLYRNTEHQYNPSMIVSIDYDHPLKNGDLELGSSVRHSNNLADFVWEDFSITEGKWMPDSSRFNDYRLQRTIYALYGTYGSKWKEVSYKVGIRNELVHRNMTEYLTNQSVPLQYFRIFPTLALSFPLSKTSSMKINYGLRLRRPYEGQLNPYLNVSAPYTYRSGNPYLLPSMTHSFETGIVKTGDKGTFESEVYYRYGTDIITSLKHPFSENIILVRPENLDKVHNAGALISYRRKLNKRASATAATSYSYTLAESQELDQALQPSQYKLTGRVGLSYRSQKGGNLNLSFAAIPENIRNQNDPNPYYACSINGSQKLMKGRATISGNFRYASLRKGTTLSDSYESTYVSALQRPRAFVSIQYLIIKDKKFRGGRGGIGIPSGPPM